MRSGLLLLCLLLVSCQSNQPVVARGTTDQERQTSLILSGDNQAIFLDRVLTEQIRIVEHKAIRNNIGMLVVLADMQTVVDQNITVDIKCRFDRPNGEREETPWEPVVLLRHEVIPVKFTSLSPEAVKFSLYFRCSQ